MEGGVHRNRRPNHWQESRDCHLTRPWSCPEKGVHLSVGHLERRRNLPFLIFNGLVQGLCKQLPESTMTVIIPVTQEREGLPAKVNQSRLFPSIN